MRDEEFDDYEKFGYCSLTILYSKIRFEGLHGEQKKSKKQKLRGRLSIISSQRYGLC